MSYTGKLADIHDFDMFIYSLLLGGVLGNLLDRIIHGYVIDYISLNIFGYHFPIFNFADICIVLGVILLIYAVLKGEDTNEDNSNRKSRKTRQIPSE